MGRDPAARVSQRVLCETGRRAENNLTFRYRRVPLASRQWYIQLMETIALNASRWKNASDFYDAYLAALGAPEWHGRNLDASWDSLTGGDINQRHSPFTIQIRKTAQMGDGARELVKGFKALIAEARAAGHSVAIELLP